MIRAWYDHIQCAQLRSITNLCEDTICIIFNRYPVHGNALTLLFASDYWPCAASTVFQGVFGYQSKLFMLFYLTGIWSFENYMYEDLDDHRIYDNGSIQHTGLHSHHSRNVLLPNVPHNPKMCIR